MRQILFVIPLSAINDRLPDLPIYGYGLMLFVAYLLCTALARRLCRREGIDATLIPDLAIWLFVAGIVGGRVLFVTQYWHTFKTADGDVDFGRIVRLWDGGLVLYGAIAGGAAGYFAFDYFVLSRRNVSRWKMIDIIAPCVALGVALGRIGCLFTGCCYGDVACAHSYPLEFPVHSAAWVKMVQLGNQTPYGFVLKEGSVQIDGVEPGSAAADAGLRRGDLLLKVNGNLINRQQPIPPFDTTLELTILREDGQHTIAFAPTSIGVNPTQVYETISMCLLLFFLLSYFPYRRRDGEVMVLLMVGYGVHRFLNEMLRTDTDPVAFGLTLSQNVSIGVLIAAGILGFLVWRRPTIAESPPPPAPASDAPTSPAALPPA